MAKNSAGGKFTFWTVVLAVVGGLLGDKLADVLAEMFGVEMPTSAVQSPQYVVTQPGTGAVEIKQPSPTTGQIVNEAVQRPLSLWAIAGIGFVSVFLIAQLRAASHEAGSAAVGVYREAQDTTRKLSKPNTKNQSRFAKGEE